VYLRVKSIVARIEKVIAAKNSSWCWWCFSTKLYDISAILVQALYLAIRLRMVGSDVDRPHL
jgi:hypothetical protein